MAKITGPIQLGAGDVSDEHFTGVLDSDKQEHLHKAGTNFALAIGGTVSAREEIVYVCEAASAVVRGFHALLNGATTTGTVSFDVKKNGVTILSGTVDFTSADASKAVKDGTMSSTALVAGDILSIELSLATSPDGTGPWAWVEVDENAG